jgi:hypothetical protein
MGFVRLGPGSSGFALSASHRSFGCVVVDRRLPVTTNEGRSKFPPRHDAIRPLRNGLVVKLAILSYQLDRATVASYTAAK